MRISDKNKQPEVIISALEVKFNYFEEGFKRFKSMVQKEKILSLYKERSTYEKPSVKSRRKHREALERKRIAECREQQILSGEWERRQKVKEQKRKRKMEEARKGNEQR